MRPLLVLLLALSVAGCGIGRRSARPAPAPTAVAAGPAAAASAGSGPISTNDRPVEVEPLNEDQIPDAPPPAPVPPDPALLARAIAPPSSKRAKPVEADVALNLQEARSRLQARLTALGFPALTPAGELLTSGPALRNPGGFSAEADCTAAGDGGRPRLRAAWIEARIDGRRNGARVELLARFEEVRESPVRDLLVRSECRSLGRLEADLLATLR